MIKNTNIKKNAFLLITILLIISFSSCKQYERPNKTTNTTSDNRVEKLTPDEFFEKINGIWIDIENCSKSHDGVAFNAWTFKNGTMSWVAYPGGRNQPGEITQVIDEGNNIYKITVHYPETKDIDFTITFDDDTIRFDNENVVWKFMGNTFDEAHNKLLNEYSQTYMNFPKLNFNAPNLDKDIFILQKQIGKQYLISAPGFKVAANNIFPLTNVENVDFYRDRSAGNTYYGVKNGKVVIFGIIGIYQTDKKVKDFLDETSLTIFPKVYNGYDSSNNCYVWKTNNGYMALHISPLSSLSYTEMPVISAIYVKDINYLSYAK